MFRLRVGDIISQRPPMNRPDELPPGLEIWWCEAQLASNPDISGVGVGRPNARLAVELNLTFAANR